VAAQLHISRMPARGALKRPGSEGSVESVANRDTRVAPIRAERVAQAILVIAALQAPGTRPGVSALSTAGDRRMASLDRDRARAPREGT
jgi:DNA-binding GntR family transcriptional regulator